MPAAVRVELDRLTVERAFSGHQALAEWLQAQGYRIDNSVQRYGVSLRRQLQAIELTRHQAHALAAAGLGAAGTVDALTAITVQQIQQQVPSILLQAAEPESSEETKTRADSIGAGTAEFEGSGKEPGEMSPSVSASREIKTLELHDFAAPHAHYGRPQPHNGRPAQACRTTRRAITPGAARCSTYSATQEPASLRRSLQDHAQRAARHPFDRAH